MYVNEVEIPNILDSNTARVLQLRALTRLSPPYKNSYHTLNILERHHVCSTICDIDGHRAREF